MELPQLLREITYLKSKGLSIRAIAAELGVNRGRVARALKAGTLRQLPQNQPASPSAYPLATNIFVGYQRELEELMACLEDTLRGRENLVMLVGEPGIGKTRMAQELANSATQRGAQVLWARYQENLGTPPYWPWAQAVRSFALAHKAEEIRSVMGKGIGYIAEIAPELKEIAPDLEPLPQLEPELGRMRLFEAVTTFFRNAASIQPLVFIIDNLHWADRPSLLLLEFLVQELREAPILIVGTYRSEGLQDHPLPLTLGELTKEQRFRRIDLAGFTPEDVEWLIKLFGFSEPPQAFVDHVYRRTEGNPLFVTEVVRLLIQQGKLTLAPASDHPPSQISEDPAGYGRGINLPDGVRDAIGRRLFMLSDACKGMLTQASIIGREFGLDVLLRLADEIPRGQWLDLLDEAVAARIIDEVPSTVGQYRFTHILIQATLSSRLSAARRAQLHGEIGETLEELLGAKSEACAADLAHHFAQAAPLLGSHKVARYSLLAGERALSAFAWENAILHFQRGLEAKEGQPMDANTAALLFGLGRAKSATLVGYQAQDAQDVLEILKRAFDFYVEAGDVPEAVAIAQSPTLGNIFRTSSEAAQLLARAFVLVPSDSQEAGSLLTNYVGALGMHEGDYSRAMEVYSQGLAIARRAQDATLEMATTAQAAQVDRYHLHPRRGLEKSLRVIELARLVDDPNAEVLVRRVAVSGSLVIGDLEGARVHAAAMLSLTERLGHRQESARAFWWNAEVSRLEGDWKAGREYSDRGLEVAPQDSRTLGTRAVLECETGEIVQSEARIEQLLEAWRLSDTRRASYAASFPAVVIPVVTRITGVADWLDAAQEAAEALLSSPAVNPLQALTVRTGQALVAVQRSDIAAAEEQYAALESQRGTMLPGWIANVDHLLGLLAQTMGKHDQALAHFEDALAFCQKAGYRPELAWTCHDYADALLVGVHGHAPLPGDRTKAVSLLDESLAISTELGMRPLMERADALLERAEPQPVRAPLYPDGLTRRELEVLHLIAIGESNRQIAKELVLSVRTVERHVTNIYAKIHARGRADATAYAFRQGISGSP